MRFLLKTVLLAGLLLLAAGGLWLRQSLVTVPVNDATIGLLKAKLATEYAVAIAQDPERSVLDKGRGLLDLEKIRLISVRALGDDRQRVLRARVEVDGAAPPDGRPVRYVRLERGPLGGWVPAGDASALDYYLELF